MNKTLAFIEALGRDARLAQSPASELASAALAAGVDPGLAEALARRDPVELKRVLSTLLLSLGLVLPLPGHAMVFSPDEQEQPEAAQTEPEAENGEEKPSTEPTNPARAASPPATEPAQSQSDPPDDAAPADEAAQPESEIEGNMSEVEGEADDSADLEAIDDGGDESAEEPTDDSDSEESDDDDLMAG